MAWWNARSQEQESSRYVAATTQTDNDQQLQEAQEYNRSLTNLQIADPYQGGDPQQESDYWQALRTPGTDVMGVIVLPGAPSLPIYHGTSEEAMARGVGHLYGSSLPVGGAGTHAVLSAHSGIPGNKLFDPLHKINLGDQFTIQTMGSNLVYRVRNIQVVTPQEAEKLLQIQEGKDQVTLVTCYPYGVNSHRLLVTGERVDAVGDGGVQPVNTYTSTSLLWGWLIPVLTVALLLAAWKFWPRRK